MRERSDRVHLICVKKPGLGQGGEDGVDGVEGEQRSQERAKLINCEIEMHPPYTPPKNVLTRACRVRTNIRCFRRRSLTVDEAKETQY